MPTACSSAASARAKRSASSRSPAPARPSVIIGGHSVNGRFSRATRPPSWSTLTQSGVSPASSCDCARQVGDLLRRLDVAREEDHAAEIELARDRAHLGRDREAVEPDDGELSDVAAQVPQGHPAHDIASAMYDSRVHIHASAPTRIDLAGGTLDIWPLYLFHDGAQTLNAAISLRASCDLRSRPDRRIAIVSEDAQQRVEVEHWSQLRDSHDLRLLGRLLHHFRAEGVELTTRSDSPVGAGIAGSSALNIAVCGALNAWSGGHRTADEIFQIAMNVEAQAIDVPTGAQDYRPAYLRRHLRGRARRQRRPPRRARRASRRAADAPRARLHQRLAQLRHQQLGRDQAAHRRRHAACSAASRASATSPPRCATALERRDWPEVGRQIAAEWENRKQLAPGVTTPEIDAMLDAAQKAGALGGKVCGAGGGGCLFCFGDPADIPAIRQALHEAGARVLDFTIEARGLLIDKF